MAVKLRLKRMGGAKKPFYRIVASDSRSPRDGKFIELLGTYNPLKGKEVVELKEEAIISWLNKGAQPTETVRNILSSKGVMKKYAESKKKVSKKAEVKKEVKEEATKKASAKKTPAKKTSTKKVTTKKKD